MNPMRYSLSSAWLTYCHALTVPVSAVLALAGQGRVLEAHHRLQQRLAGLGTGATTVARPRSAPFVLVAATGPSDPAAEQSPAMRDEAAGVPALSAPSGAPTTDRARVAALLAQLGLPVFPAKKVRRFRPLVRSRLLPVASVSVPSISVQVFILKTILGGTSNATA